MLDALHRKRGVVFCLLAAVLGWSLVGSAVCARAVTLGTDEAGAAVAEDRQYISTVKRYPYHFPETAVVGQSTWHEVQSKETLLDIAREYGLGYNEIVLFYPRLDPWVPPPQQRLIIPSMWVLPPTKHQQLLINLPELRLYYFNKKDGTVQTYPIGIGDEGWETPLGIFRIQEKRPNPTWYIPKSLQAKYGMASMPPGPENPLGKFFMKFSAGAYGIHGTHIPWGVGRLISHGCIRSYPEHIRLLFPQVKVGSHLEIIYEPVKIGRLGDQVYVEAHPDVYSRLPNYLDYAMEKLWGFPDSDLVDVERFEIAVTMQNGAPTNVTRAEGATPSPEQMVPAPEAQSPESPYLDGSPPAPDLPPVEKYDLE